MKTHGVLLPLPYTPFITLPPLTTGTIRTRKTTAFKTLPDSFRPRHACLPGASLCSEYFYILILFAKLQTRINVEQLEHFKKCTKLQLVNAFGILFSDYNLPLWIR